MESAFLLSSLNLPHRLEPERIQSGRNPAAKQSSPVQRLKCIGLAICLAAATRAAGASFTTDFSTDPGGTALGKAKIENGILKLQDLQEYIDGISGLPMFGSYVFQPIDGAQKVASFTADFNVSIHGGTETPAQGFSFVLADDIAGFTDPFREGGATAEGSGFSQGLIISFDTVDNLAGFGANGNDPGDAPGIIVRIGGQRVAAKRFTGLRTGPANNQTPVFVPVQIKLDADGTLDVVYNGTRVYDNFGIPYAPIAGNFGLGSGTAELTAAIRANHWFDNMSITTTTVGVGPVLLSALPLGTSVRPDAAVQVQIDNLGVAAVQVQFDAQPVQHQASTAGTVTSITYDPPGTLAPASTHNVTVTYGGKTLTWSFTVLNATIIPASFAAAPNTVDTATSGFKVRVHQLDATAPGGNTYQRAEDQLAGKLGPNVADLTSPPANSDGTFNLDLINMDQAGGDAGLFNSAEGHTDSLIPGIPGTTGSDDNIAMEVRGYLDLQQGVYAFGLVSDDNARLTIGPDPRDATSARLIDIAIGTATSTVLVDANGLYPFRVVWAEGGGAANLELWTVTAAGTRILLNDRATTSHVKVYRQLKAGVQSPPYVSLAKPAPAEVNVSTTPKIELAITEESTQVNQASIKLLINGIQVSLAPSDISKTGSVTTIRYTVTAPLLPKAEQRIRLEFADSAAQNVTREYTFTTGRGPAGAGFAGSQWDFDDGTLAATVGHDLHYIDDTLASRYQFGTTTQFSIPGINGVEAKVLHIPFNQTSEQDAVGPIFKRLGLRVNHGLGSNGGSLTNKLNQYTLIMDVLWGTDGTGFGSILQTHDFANPTDGDMFWRASDGSYGKGCCSLYDGISQTPGHNHVRGEWARVVFSVDLASTPRKLAKFVNGFKHREDLSGDGNALDSRFALPPEFFMFGDGDDNERSECYVNSLQIRQGAMSDEDVSALGGASAFGIPAPAIGTAAAPPPPLRMQPSRAGNDLTINLTGGRGPFTLQRRADLDPGTQWQDVGPATGASVTISNAFTGAQGYYRVRGQ